MQNKKQHLINKTESLEKGIEGFPSIYIMGAAATGKSTAVQMLLAQHPEVEFQIVDLASAGQEITGILQSAREQMLAVPYWVIFENVPASSEFDSLIADFIMEMPENGRVILIGRENLPEALLPFLWKQKLEIIPQSALSFSMTEVFELEKMMGSSLSAAEVWKSTGGWAGCVNLMLRLAAGSQWCEVGEHDSQADAVWNLLNSYEIRTYIENVIVGGLSEEEKQILMYSQNCPWINVELCQDVWHMENAGILLENMTRKGFILYNKKSGYWKTAPLFRNLPKENVTDVRLLGQWYEKNDCLKEALCCYERNEKWPINSPEYIYLQGVRCYEKQDLIGFNQAICNLKNLEMQDEFLKNEFLLNLYFRKMDFSLDDWLKMLESLTKEFEGTGRKFRLYSILGNSCTYLCGVRDLTGLFACTKKEENRRAKIWKNGLGEREWKNYLLARMDYYLETERQDSIHAEEWDALQAGENDLLARVHLFGKLQRIFKDEDYAEEFMKGSEELLSIEEGTGRKVAEAFVCIHAPWLDEPERLSRWLKRCGDEAKTEVSEANYSILSCMAKGYLLLNQYKKAEKILKRLIPYLKKYRRTRMWAEALFQQAIICWKTGRHSQALQSTIESFYISGDARYVNIYTSYGRRAKDVLEAYEEWYHTMYPEGWSRKKKYQYGNVLRMPMADYIGVVLRGVRREARSGQLFQLQQEEVINEHLTMMETIILQDIGHGLTNNEICLEQNLKMPTVKSHIYSLYKKLGVNSRVQATIKGKEMGILE